MWLSDWVKSIFKMRAEEVIAEVNQDKCEHNWRYSLLHDVGWYYDSDGRLMPKERRVCAKCLLKQVRGIREGDTDKWFRSVFAVIGSDAAWHAKRWSKNPNKPYTG